MGDRRRTDPLLERPVMRAAFRTELRARLMSEAVVMFAPRPSRGPLFLWLRPALAAAVIVVVALAGTTSVAASSLPGDLLYAWKRATEDVQVALTVDDLARMRILSDLADRRLDELAEAARQRPSAAPTATAEYASAAERFADAVDKLRDAKSDAKRAAAEAVADVAHEKHIATLDSLKQKLPTNAQPQVQKVIEQERKRASETDRRRDGGDGGKPSDRQRGGDGEAKTSDRERGDGEESGKPSRTAERPAPRK